MSNKMTTTLRYGAVAAIAAIPALGAREPAEKGELSLTDRVVECADAYEGRVEQVIGDNAEIVTFLGCSAMESCKTGQTTQAVAEELGIGSDELAVVARRALPVAEDMVQAFGLRSCVEMEVVAPEGSDQPQYSQYMKGLVPPVFYGEN